MATAVCRPGQMRDSRILDVGCSEPKASRTGHAARNLAVGLVPRKAEPGRRLVAARIAKADSFWFAARALLAWPCVWLLIRFWH